MIPEAHPLIEAVTEPIADNVENRLATHVLLEKTFDVEHPDIGKALACFEKSQLRKFTTLCKVLPWAVAVIALCIAVLSYLPEIRFVQSISKFSLFEPWIKPPLPNGLTKEERIILGEPKLDRLEQKRRLQISDPENPAYYAEYAQAWVSEHEKLPTDYFETVARIDPHNAFFLYYAASVIGKDSIEKNIYSGASGEPRIVDGVKLGRLAREQEFSIKDQINHEKALALIDQAAQLTRFETYDIDMIAARVYALPRRTFAEYATSMIHVAYTSSPYVELIKVAELLSARAEELSKSGNKEGFLKIAAQRDALIDGLANNPNVSIVNELVYRVIASSTSVNFHAAAERINLTELTEVYRKQRDGMQEDNDQRRIRDKKGAEEAIPISSYSGLHYTSLPTIARQVKTPPQFSESELKPMRIAEHELVGGIGVLAVAFFILPSALMVFLFRFMAPKSIRLTAQRMASLMRFSDWVWVVGLGVALPVVIFLIISRWSLMSGRDWGVTYIYFAFPGVHLGALLLGLLIVPAFVLRRRLVKRLAPFRIPDRFGRLPLFVIGGLFVWAVAAFPIVKNFGLLDYLIFYGPPALCLCFLLANALRAIFEKSSTRFTQAATALAVLPAYPIAIVALCLLLPIYHAGEKHWLAKETLNRIDPDAPDLGAYEFKVAAQKRKETNAIMGIE